MITPTQQDNLSTWLDYLATIHVSAIDMGLERVLPVFALLQITPPATVITVAGTNGKGSVTATIASILTEAKHKVALYQSPHLLCFNERVRIDGVMASDDELIQAFFVVERARVRCRLSLSFFEMITLAAFWLFFQAKCDVWVLEVGLGGLLDVVNVIDPTLAVITNIAIDHTDWLGADKESIGRQKAGIIRDGIAVIYGETDMPNSVMDATNKSVLLQFGRDFSYSVCDEGFVYSDKALTLKLPLPNLSIHNTSIAVAAVLASGIAVCYNSLAAGIKNTHLAGRFDRRCFLGRDWVFDVAHNVAGLEFLLSQWLDTHNKKTWHVVFSMLADKPIDAVLARFVQAVTQWGVHITGVHIATLDNPRAISKEMLAKKIVKYTDIEVNCYPTMGQAAVAVQELPDDYPVLCFGSFHTVAEALVGLQSRHT